MITALILVPVAGRLAAINIVRTDIDSYHLIASNVKDRSQIRSDFRRVNDVAIVRREPVNLVGTQARIKRVFLKDTKRFPRHGLSSRGQFRQGAPECPSRPELVFHSSPGYGSLSAVSKSTTRSASASAIPCLKDSGIQESSFSTTNLATCARSLADNALNCSIISVALISQIYTPKRVMSNRIVQRAIAVFEPLKIPRAWLA